MRLSILGAGWLGLALYKCALDRGDFILNASTRNLERRRQILTYTKAGSLDSTGAIPDNHSHILAPHALYALEVPLLSTADASFFQTDVLVITIPPGRKRAAVETLYPQEIGSILAMAEQEGCKHILYTSSTGVYGKAEGVVNEDSPALPVTASAKAVLAAEQLIQDSAMPATILRLAGLYGPDRHPGRWFANRNAIPAAAAPINLVHQQDVLQAILAVVDQGAWEAIFNVCAKAHPTKGQYYNQAITDMGGSPIPLEAGGAPGKVVDASKIRKQLNWTPRYDALELAL